MGTIAAAEVGGRPGACEGANRDKQQRGEEWLRFFEGVLLETMLEDRVISSAKEHRV